MRISKEFKTVPQAAFVNRMRLWGIKVEQIVAKIKGRIVAKF